MRTWGTLFLLLALGTAPGLAWAQDEQAQDDAPKKAPKPFRPPSLHATPSRYSSFGPAGTGAAASAAQGAAAPSANEAKVPLTPFSWSGKAKVSGAEEAPQKRQGFHEIVDLCPEGTGVSPDAAEDDTCCDLGQWFNRVRKVCEPTRQRCAARSSAKDCFKATAAHGPARTIPTVDEGCKKGETLFLNKLCCPWESWASEAADRCYATKQDCLAAKAKECYLMKRGRL